MRMATGHCWGSRCPVTGRPLPLLRPSCIAQATAGASPSSSKAAPLPPPKVAAAPAPAPEPAAAATASAPEPAAAATASAPEPAAAATASAAEGDAAVQPAKSKEYSAIMNKRMGTSLTYNHENGLDYNRILPDLIVGSCLQTAADVDRLVEQEGVTTVFSLQEDCDMEYFKLDLKPIQARCAELGTIKHIRFPIRDFDPYDLRRKLPRAVSRLAREHDPEGGGTVYIHCTAGMGRAPATALAYMMWIRGWQLDEAHKELTSLRRCGPKIEAIRSATSDLLLGTQPVMTTIAVHRFGSAKKIQVAGLDVGWHKPLDMGWDSATNRFVLHRLLYPGKYQYKLVMDGVWSYSADHPTAQDGENINNTLEVIPLAMDADTVQKQVRYLTTGTALTNDEQEELRAMLSPWHNKLDGAVFTLPEELVPLEQPDC